MINLPDIKFVKPTPKLVRDISLNKNKGNVSNLLEHSDPIWVVDLVSAAMTYDDVLKVNGWAAQLKNGIGEKVLFSNPSKRYPFAHKTITAPAEINGSISTVTELNEVVVSGVSTDLVLTQGDYLGFEHGGNYHLALVISSSGVGSDRTLTFDPPLPHDLGVGGATVRFVDCKILMALLPDSYSAPDELLSPVSFTLYETR